MNARSSSRAAPLKSLSGSIPAPLSINGYWFNSGYGHPPIRACGLKSGALEEDRLKLTQGIRIKT